jgi:hypothetical protein
MSERAMDPQQIQYQHRIPGVNSGGQEEKF